MNTQIALDNIEGLANDVCFEMAQFTESLKNLDELNLKIQNTRSNTKAGVCRNSFIQLKNRIVESVEEGNASIKTYKDHLNQKKVEVERLKQRRMELEAEYNCVKECIDKYENEINRYKEKSAVLAQKRDKIKLVQSLIGVCLVQVDTKVEGLITTNNSRTYDVLEFDTNKMNCDEIREEVWAKMDKRENVNTICN